MTLPHGAVGWSAVCDCGVFGSYSLTFWSVTFIKYQACNGYEFDGDEQEIPVTIFK